VSQARDHAKGGAAAVDAVFSSLLPNFTNLLPSWWGV